MGDALARVSPPEPPRLARCTPFEMSGCQAAIGVDLRRLPDALSPRLFGLGHVGHWLGSASGAHASEVLPTTRTTAMAMTRFMIVLSAEEPFSLCPDCTTRDWRGQGIACRNSCHDCTRMPGRQPDALLATGQTRTSSASIARRAPASAEHFCMNPYNSVPWIVAFVGVSRKGSPSLLAAIIRDPDREIARRRPEQRGELPHRAIREQLPPRVVRSPRPLVRDSHPSALAVQLVARPQFNMLVARLRSTAPPPGMSRTPLAAPSVNALGSSADQHGVPVRPAREFAGGEFDAGIRCVEHRDRSRHVASREPVHEHREYHPKT